jgi:hypothetical protein
MNAEDEDIREKTAAERGPLLKEGISEGNKTENNYQVIRTMSNKLIGSAVFVSNLPRPRLLLPTRARLVVRLCTCRIAADLRSPRSPA